MRRSPRNTAVAIAPWRKVRWTRVIVLTAAAASAGAFWLWLAQLLLRP